MTSYKGYFDENGDFIPLDSIGAVIPKNQKVIFTILDEPIYSAHDAKRTDKLNAAIAFVAAMQTSEEDLAPGPVRMNIFRELGIGY